MKYTEAILQYHREAVAAAIAQEEAGLVHPLDDAFFENIKRRVLERVKARKEQT